MKIRRAVVMGSGVMGAQIAAVLAAAGVRVHILDLASSEPPATLPKELQKDPRLPGLLKKNFRSTRSILAIEGLKHLRPSPLYSPSHLQNIIPGNFDDDMAVLADADWVIEAVIEKLDIKKDLHQRIAAVVRPGTPVTTNTSGISLSSICDGLPEHYQATFFGTHFFNPPRYMKLLEVIAHPRTDRKLMATLSDWIDRRLGKGLVEALDTVNFIANRIGVFANQITLKHMAELGLNIETVDALTGKLMGRPSSATFRTMDVVGLDTFVHVANNTYDKAPDDPFRDVFKSPQWVLDLIKAGHLGQKSGDVGCFKKTTGADGKRLILAYRPDSKDWQPQQVAPVSWLEEASAIRDLGSRYAFIFKQTDPAATFLWRVMRDVWSYSALLLDSIAAGEPRRVDEAIRWGFNWELGPFELWQLLGVDNVFDRMKKEGAKVPSWMKPGKSFYTDEKPARAPAMLTRAKKVMDSKSATLKDLGEGVACIEFHTKMNAVDRLMLETMQKSIAAVTRDFDALVIGNEADNFSAGANLKEISELIRKNEFTTIDTFIREFQGTVQMIKFAPFPSVSCPRGMVLGGGCEIALHASLRVAAGETYAGLVEAGVGVIPAGGGTKELALRAYDYAAMGERADPMQFLQRAFLLIGMAKVSTSGFDACEMGLMPQGTTLVTLARDHQIEQAKQEALHMVRRGYIPAQPRTGIPVVGDPGIQTFKLMLYNMVEGRQISRHDALVAEKMATVLCGGEVDPGSVVSEQGFLDLERRGFVELCREPKTLERIEHMLKTGQALRN
ncbi:MAG: 3-hydroxyacyl-CoA dehydrogenase [Pseudomonadota bacterium]|jgi:3-hydroxyacyl-CoA dehydrogenase